ncbi:MAG: hypothetical protein ACPG4T_21245, partial [Nannocystaceae bacterium]
MARPNKRSTLRLLNRASLLEIGQAYDLDVHPRMNHEALVDTLAKSKRASFEKIIRGLSRNDLKHICRHHGLDDGGRAKQPIADRILGVEQAPDLFATVETDDFRPTIASALAELGDDTLKQLARTFRASLPRGRARRQTVLARVAGHIPSLGDLLANLDRAELRAVAQAHGLKGSNPDRRELVREIVLAGAIDDPPSRDPNRADDAAFSDPAGADTAQAQLRTTPAAGQAPNTAQAQLRTTRAAGQAPNTAQAQLRTTPAADGAAFSDPAGAGQGADTTQASGSPPHIAPISPTEAGETSRPPATSAAKTHPAASPPRVTQKPPSPGVQQDLTAQPAAPAQPQTSDLSPALKAHLREVGAPKPGDLAVVRHRRYWVEDVVVNLAAPSAQTRVDLVCLDDDAAGRRLTVLWELELGAQVLRPADAGLGEVTALDDPQTFAAYLRAVGWSCVTATRSDLCQAPFRAGIRIQQHQMEPLRKALELPRANLFIADDVGLGKTIEAGLVMQELLLRQRIDFILVVAPAAITLQWRSEMARRFGLHFEIVDRTFVSSRRRDRGMDINPWSTHNRFLISYQTLRRPEYREPLLRLLGQGRRRKSL